MLKLKKTKGVYENNARTNTVKAETYEAYSYGHWKYATELNGLKIYNSYFYSQTTSKHQADFRSLKGVEDAIIVKTRFSLMNLKKADLEQLIIDEIKELRKLSKTPRKRKATKAKLREETRTNINYLRQIRGGVK